MTITGVPVESVVCTSIGPPVVLTVPTGTGSPNGGVGSPEETTDLVGTGSSSGVTKSGSLVLTTLS